MSKVIKSSSVIIQSPKLLAQRGAGILGEPGSEGEDSKREIDALEEAEMRKRVALEEVLRVEAQADEIMEETEQMVKDLLKTAREEAAKIIGNARDEADKLLSSGKESLHQVEEQAYQQGYQSGYAEGQKAAEAQCEVLTQEAKGVLVAAQDEREQIICGAEDEIVQLVMAIARKVIGQEIKVSPDYIVNIVKNAVKKATDREELTVRVNPEDLDNTINAHNEIFQSTKGIRKLKVLSDPAIDAGGCVVDSTNGTVDARIERQLDEIEQSLMEVSPNA